MDENTTKSPSLTAARKDTVDAAMGPLQRLASPQKRTVFVARPADIMADEIKRREKRGEKDTYASVMRIVANELKGIMPNAPTELADALTKIARGHSDEYLKTISEYAQKTYEQQPEFAEATKNLEKLTKEHSEIIKRNKFLRDSGIGVSTREMDEARKSRKVLNDARSAIMTTYDTEIKNATEIGMYRTFKHELLPAFKDIGVGDKELERISKFLSDTVTFFESKVKRREEFGPHVFKKKMRNNLTKGGAPDIEALYENKTLTSTLIDGFEKQKAFHEKFLSEFKSARDEHFNPKGNQSVTQKITNFVTTTGDVIQAVAKAAGINDKVRSVEEALAKSTSKTLIGQMTEWNNKLILIQRQNDIEWEKFVKRSQEVLGRWDESSKRVIRRLKDAAHSLQQIPKNVKEGMFGLKNRIIDAIQHARGVYRERKEQGFFKGGFSTIGTLALSLVKNLFGAIFSKGGLLRLIKAPFALLASVLGRVGFYALRAISLVSKFALPILAIGGAIKGLWNMKEWFAGQKIGWQEWVASVLGGIVAIITEPLDWIFGEGLADKIGKMTAHFVDAMLHPIDTFTKIMDWALVKFQNGWDRLLAGVDMILSNLPFVGESFKRSADERLARVAQRNGESPPVVAAVAQKSSTSQVNAGAPRNTGRPNIAVMNNAVLPNVAQKPTKAPLTEATKTPVITPVVAAVAQKPTKAPLTEATKTPVITPVVSTVEQIAKENQWAMEVKDKAVLQIRAKKWHEEPANDEIWTRQEAARRGVPVEVIRKERAVRPPLEVAKTGDTMTRAVAKVKATSKEMTAKTHPSGRPIIAPHSTTNVINASKNSNQSIMIGSSPSAVSSNSPIPSVHR